MCKLAFAESGGNTVSYTKIKYNTLLFICMNCSRVCLRMRMRVCAGVSAIEDYQ